MCEQDITVPTILREKLKIKKENSNKVRPKCIYTCKYCQSEYTQKTNLYRHIRRLHKPRGDVPITVKENYTCGTCDQEFTTQLLLSFHQALLHPVRKGRVVITCPSCPFSGLKAELLGHYVSKHNIKIELEELNFPSAIEFYDWKCNIERNTLAQYAKRQKHHVLVNGVTIDMLYCHRDGFYKPEGKNIRNLKIKGTNKINGYCPAFMKVMTYADDRVSVLFLKTHVGHDYELDRLALTREERDTIAAKIAIGVAFDEILAELQTSEHERLRIMTRKDLYNIETSYNLNSSTVRGRNIKAEVLEHHNAALKIPQSYITADEDFWNVKSTSQNDVLFKVELVNTDCDQNKCIFKCPFCEVCGHSYKCSCSDNQKMIMCKHKHIVHLTRKEPQILIQDQIPTSSVSALTTNTNLTPSIVLDNCPQLTALVIQDIPNTVSNETILVPTDSNTRKALIRHQLAGILQAVESTDVAEELEIIQSLLEPIVQTVQSMKETEDLLLPEIIQPVCKQLRLDDQTGPFFATTADSAGTPIIATSQLQSTVVDEHNNPILITFTLSQSRQ